jgi:DNA topoisomerase IB
VLAGAVRMLDVGVFRAGGEQYAPGDDDEDGTFGLATLRREHVSLKRGAVVFAYPAKGGIPRTLRTARPAAAPGRRSLLRRKGGGEELLAYKVKRDWCDVKTGDLNARSRSWRGRTTPARTCAPGTPPCWRPSRWPPVSAENGVPGPPAAASGS